MIRFVALMVLAAAACGGKAVIDAPIGAGGAGGQTTATTGSSANPFTAVVSAASGTEPVCADIEAAYAAVLEDAKTCTPGVTDPCTKVVPSDLRNCCTPNVAVNQGETEAILALKTLTSDYAEKNCLVPCAADCTDPPPAIGICDNGTGKCTSASAPDPGP